jgi:hypothetical protein
MITKTAIVLALLVGTASTVLAAPKHSSANRAYDVYSVSGKYLGSDPDPTIRASLARDHGY